MIPAVFKAKVVNPSFLGEFLGDQGHDFCFPSPRNFKDTYLRIAVKISERYGSHRTKHRDFPVAVLAIIGRP